MLLAVQRTLGEERPTRLTWDEQGLTELQWKLFVVGSFGDTQVTRGVLPLPFLLACRSPLSLPLGKTTSVLLGTPRAPLSPLLSQGWSIFRS